MIIKKLIAEALVHLKPLGYLLIEHGYDQAEAVQNLLQLTGFINIASKLDLVSVARVTMGQKEL